MTASAVPAKSPSVWEDFIDIFVSPSAVFARREKASFVLPMVVLVVVMVVLYLGTRSLVQPALDADMQRRLAKAMAQNPNVNMEQAQKGMAFFSGFAWLFLLIFIPIGIFLTGFVLWFIGKLFDATETGGTAIVVATYAAFPKILQSVAGAIIAVVTDSSKLDGMSRLSTGPAHFVSAATASPVLVAVLARFDIFTLWSTVLLGIGLAVTGKIPRGKAFLAAAIVWIIAALPSVLGALRA